MQDPQAVSQASSTQEGQVASQPIYDFSQLSNNLAGSLSRLTCPAWVEMESRLETIRHLRVCVDQKKVDAAHSLGDTLLLYVAGVPYAEGLIEQSGGRSYFKVSRMLNTPKPSLDLGLDQEPLPPAAYAAKIPFEARVEIGKKILTLQEAQSLSLGQCLVLDRLLGEPVDLAVNGTIIASGEVCVLENLFALRVTSLRDGGASISTKSGDVIRPVSFESFGDVNVRVDSTVQVVMTVVLGYAKKELLDIQSFGEGTILALNSSPEEFSDIYLNGTLTARGEIVPVGDRFGIRIRTWAE